MKQFIFLITFAIRYPYRTFVYQSDERCDSYFDLGKTYLKYATNNHSFLYSSICSRTEWLERVSPDELTQLSLLYNGFKNQSQPGPIKVHLSEDNYQLALSNLAIERLSSEIKYLKILAIILTIARVFLGYKLYWRNK